MFRSHFKNLSGVSRKAGCLLILAVFFHYAQAQQVTVTSEEVKLYDLINEYRGENGLDPIPFSNSLTTVAQIHVRDLVENDPVQGSCNMHSWSDQGEWSACCYTPDHANAQCMWDKPRELSSYPGNGYENSYGGGGTATAQGALNGWKSSSAHNDVILNQDIWTAEWHALGVGILEGYAVIWFGHETDPEGEPVVSTTAWIYESGGLRARITPSGLRVKPGNGVINLEIRNLQGQLLFMIPIEPGQGDVFVPLYQSGLHILKVSYPKRTVAKLILNP